MISKTHTHTHTKAHFGLCIHLDFLCEHSICAELIFDCRLRPHFIFKANKVLSYVSVMVKYTCIPLHNRIVRRQRELSHKSQQHHINCLLEPVLMQLQINNPYHRLSIYLIDLLEHGLTKTCSTVKLYLL